jgi:hypothetical protein
VVNGDGVVVVMVEVVVMVVVNGDRMVVVMVVS